MTMVPIAGVAAPTSLRTRRTRNTPRRRCGGCCARTHRSNNRCRLASAGDRDCGGRLHSARANRTAIHPCRGRNNSGRLSPSVTAGRAEQCRHHHSAMCDEHLARHASRTRVMNHQERSAVRTASPMIHVRRHACPSPRAAFVDRSLADDAAIWRHAAAPAAAAHGRLRGISSRISPFCATGGDSSSTTVPGLFGIPTWIS